MDKVANQALVVIDPMADEYPHVVSTGLTDLGAGNLVEAWISGADISRGKTGNVTWSKTDSDVFASIGIAEGPDLKVATESVYRELLGFLRGTPYIPCRFWNYVRDINLIESGSERYWRFNQGRSAAFEYYGASQFPAACALGGSKSVVYVHATTRAGRYFENPRQVSAFKYPKQYGPSSPSFSRATTVRNADGVRVHISGTASIVGHESKHAGDLDGQLETTCDNLRLLLDSIGEASELRLEFCLLKAYVRNSDETDRVREIIRQRFPEIPVRYLAADICRRELLVEMEGLGQQVP